MHRSGHHDESDTPHRQRRLLAAVALNLLITIAEVIGGLLSGSIALLSDALHNFGDTASLGTSYFAITYSKKGANLSKTFGYKRIEVVAAFFNLVVLALISLFLIKEAVERAADPQPIRGGLMFAVASVGLAANIATALLLHRDARDSVNVRSAYLHIVTDAISSVGVVIAGVLVWAFDIVLVDPLLTIVISAFILYQVYHLLRDTTNILMNSVPPDVDVESVVAEMEGIALVRDVHHVHVWSMDEHQAALEAHVVIDEEVAAQMDRIRTDIKLMLESRFGISHSTLEIEFERCESPEDCL